MSALHHLHAQLASGTKARAPVSMDIGLDVRVRLDGGEDARKTEIVRRLTVLWNMHEGIPTAVLEAGAIRQFYDATNALCGLLAADPLDFAAVLSAAQEVERKWGAITIEPTCHGKRAHCGCSEAA